MSDTCRENYNFQKIIVAAGASLFVIKFAAYLLTNSVAIFTDAAESAVNIAAGCIGLYALYLSARPADKTHPFGHGRIELISASVEGSMIAIAGILIVFKAFGDLLNPEEISSLDVGLLLVIFAAAVNYAIGTVAVRKGRKNRSLALESSGRHLRTDTMSSAGIVIGLTAVYAGAHFGYDLYILDPLMALLFGALVVITGVRVIKKATDGIMDKADVEVLEKVVESLNEHRSKDWIDIHSLMVIKYGSRLHIEMHVTFPFDMTIAELDRENSRLYESVSSTFGGSVDLIMMSEPCKEFSCIHCERDCRSRRADFKERVNWNVNLLSQEHQHAYGNHVVIHGRE
ncbi:MAG: cation diffusion facilitator family transporter [Candidatus Methanoplasma sp.]|jgi:cation diffusion facilitator family transporter|nr:cation diffusion facilitator family transporter [Candidatus Methanoplasma sp.]